MTAGGRQPIRLSLAIAGLLTFSTLTQTSAEDRVPDFASSRPKGDRVPYAPLPEHQLDPPSVHFGQFRPYNPIDNFVLSRLQREKLQPKPLCDDWDFARRASLDIVGVIPTLEDLDRYFRWKPKERRSRWIDLLLNQPYYADHWTLFWGDILRERGRVLGLPENALKNYIHDSLLKNQPFDGFVRSLITASGPTETNPETAFILQDRADGDVLTVAVSEAFLGVQLRCAQCHDHPYDWWTKRDFDGMSAFWRGTRSTVAATEEIKLPNGTVVRLPRFELVSRDSRARGVFLTGVKSAAGAGREALADLLTRRDNPYFARVAVNRIWQKMLGRGLVTPSSNFSPLNPPSHPELLDWIAIEFIEHDYDLKHIIRLIARSRTYQQSSVDSPAQTASLARRNRNRPDGEDELLPGRLFEGPPLRRMTAEQINDSILIATGRFHDRARFIQRAIDVTYPPNAQSFLRIFGASDRETIVTLPAGGSIQQSLTLLNGGFVNGALRFHPDHPISRWSAANGSNIRQTIDALFMQTLTRPPTEKERRTAIDFIGNGTHDDAWEDLQWAIMNTREFQFIR